VHLLCLAFLGRMRTTACLPAKSAAAAVVVVVLLLAAVQGSRVLHRAAGLQQRVSLVLMWLQLGGMRRQGCRSKG
jgi:hypothetical protein